MLATPLVTPMIDSRGYRSNVGIIVVNKDNKLLWARRCGRASAWQFPQGGVNEGETIQEAMFRELNEELGLKEKDVACIAVSRRWLVYTLPKHFRRYDKKPLCVGQKQRWFLLRLLSSDDSVKLDETNSPEFDRWKWVDYWEPLKEVISFKKQVYQDALKEFERLLFRKK